MMRKFLVSVFTALVLATTAGVVVACSDTVETPPLVQSYTVTFRYNYDGAPNDGVFKTETVTVGSSVAKPDDPTRPQMQFDYWSTAAAAGSSRYNFSDVVMSDTDVYAQWKAPSNPPAAATLSSIAVTTQPTKTTYAVGDEIDLTGLVVTATYSDNTSKPITVTTAMLSGYDMSTEGTHTVTVTYTENGVTKTTTFTITVEDDTPAPKTLSSIAVTTQPTKTTYNIGEAIDLTGLVVTATYSDTTTATITVTESMLSYDTSSAGTKTVTITYTENNVTKTTTFTITVEDDTPAPKTLTGIAVTTQPTTTTYTVGDEIDLTGLVVTATYSDTSMAPITVTESMLSDYDMSVAATYTVKITYTEGGITKYAYFEITVEEDTPAPKTLSGIVVTNQPTKTAYYIGETIELAGLVVMATYSDTSMAPITVTESMLSDYDMSVAATYTVKITYTEGGITKYAYFTITVSPVEFDYVNVTFDKNIGYDVSGMPTGGSIVKGQKATEPTTEPTVKGFTFDGWYTAAGVKWDFDNAVNETLALYAHWTAKQYAVKYIVTGGAAPTTGTYTATAANVFETFALAAPDEDHKTFNGWYSSNAHSGTKYTQLTYADITDSLDPTVGFTFYGEFVGDTYQITYDLGGSASTYTATWKEGFTPKLSYTYGVGLSALPTAENIVISSVSYTFAGWLLDGQPITSISTTDFGDKNLVANITSKPIYTVVYDYNYVGGRSESRDVIENETAPNFTPTRDYYNFDAWYEDQDCQTAYNFDKAVTAGFTLYAKWIPIKYTLEYNVGGNGNAIQSKEFNVETIATVATLPAVTISAAGQAGGYYFIGWYSAGVGGNEVKSITRDMLDDLNGTTLVVYAQYSNLYTVTFDSVGGSAVESKQVVYNTAVQKPQDPAKDGNDFVGWYLNGSPYNFATPVTSHITLKAVWRDNPTNGLYLRITYNDWETSSAIKATLNNATPEYKVEGVTLAEGAIFYLANYENGNATSYVKPQIPYGEQNIATWITPSQLTGIAFGTADDKNAGLNYVVSDYNSEYEGFTWTLYVQAGQVAINLEATNTTLRNPDGTNNPDFTADDEDKEVYIKGCFNGYQPSDAWSNESTNVLTAKIGTKYYFTKVKLEKYDMFKLYVAEEGDEGWYGISEQAFETDKDIKLGDGSNIFFTGASGFYDIVFDTQSHTLRVEAHKTVEVKTKAQQVYAGDTINSNSFTATVGGKAVTVKALEEKVATLGSNTIKLVCGNTVVVFTFDAAEVKATEIAFTAQPSKKDYKIGETISLAGATITVKYNNGTSEVVTDMSRFTLSLNMATAVGNDIAVTITLKGTSVTTTIKINVAAATVTFYANGGTEVDDVTVTAYGQSITAPDSTRTGYTLVGWFAPGSDTPFDFEQDVFTFAGDVTLTARWTADTYTVTYNANGGTVEPASQDYSVDTGLTLPTPTRDHYNFDGWFTAAEGGTLVTAETLLANPTTTTIYAHWTIDSHTVTFDSDGGSSVGSQTITHGQTVTLPPAPEKAGYDFGGWKLGGTTYKVGDTYTVTDDIEFTAVWTAKTYSVEFRFITEGVEYTASFKDGVANPTTYTYGVGLTLPTANDIVVVGAGYEFKFWTEDEYPSADSTPCTAISDTDMGAKVFYAFISDKASVNFIFDYNYVGAPSNGVYKTEQVVIGRAVTKPSDPTREGYTFGGWYTDKECSDSKAYVFGSSVTAETRVYAKWTKKTYTVMFDSNGGSDVASKTVEHGSSVTMPAGPNKTGYTFAGWKYENTTYRAGESYANVVGAMTFTAQWTADDVTVTFDANRGTLEGDTSKTYKFDSLLPALPAPTRLGYEFAGWFDRNNHKWEEGAKLNVTSLDLVAHWDEINYTVKYVVEVQVGGTTVKATAITNEDYTKFNDTKSATFALPVPNILTEGYKFKHWTLNGEKISKIELSTFGDGEEITLTAVYEIISYTVTFNPNGGTLAAGTQATVPVDHGKTVTKPKDPTRNGWEFAGWYLDGEPYDFTTLVKKDIELVARWNGKTGAFLYGSHTPDNEDTWKRLFAAVDHNSGTEWKVAGVELRNGMQFIVVDFKGGTNDVWYKAQQKVEQYAYKSIVTISSVPGVGGYNFSVTLSNNYNGSKWTLFIKKDGSGISLEPEYNNELRDPSTDNNANKITTVKTATPGVTVYLRGNFTGTFDLSDAWSDKSTLLDAVLKNGNEFTFRHVYLKKGDAFKVYLTGKVVGDTDNGWYGGIFGGLNQAVDLSTSGENIYLGLIENGFYDIVVNTSTNKLTIKEYALPTIKTIDVKVTKTDYKWGEQFDADSVNVTITDSDGKTHNNEYMLSGNDTNITGDIVVTVTYTGPLGGEKTATFTIKVVAIKVRFMNGASEFKTEDVRYDGTVTMPARPAKEGYDFLGWLYGGTKYAEGATCANVTADMDFVAQWQIKTYNVAFNADGGTGANTAEQEIEHGGKVTNPGTPAKNGYYFDGWYYGSKKWDFEQDTVTEDGVTLKAHWTPTPYDITYVLGGGDNHSDNPDSYNIESATITLKDATRNGYTFMGWYNEDGEKVTQIENGSTGDIKLTAHWETITYNISYTFDCNIAGVEGSATFTTTHNTYTVEDAFTLDQPTPPDGVQFVAWHIGSPDSNKTISEIVLGSTGHLELYAEYTKNAMVKFTFDYNRPEGAVGSLPSNKVDNVVIGLKAPEPNRPSLDSHNFLGWFTKNGEEWGAEWIFDVNTVEEETTVYAKWEIKKFSVTFDIVGGTGANTAKQEIDYGGKVTNPGTPTKNGYDFGGWYYNGKEWNFATDTVTSNISLTATWTPTTYSITYVLGEGGTNGDNPSSYTILTDTITLKNPSRTHYTFAGWVIVTDDGDKPITQIVKGSTGNVTLKAQWTAIEYTVEYYVDGAKDNSVGNETSFRITDESIELTNPTKTGYDFDGWYLESDFSGKKISALTIGLFGGANSDSPVPLYARFIIKKFTVTFDLNYTGAPTNPTVDVEYNTVVPANKIPTDLTRDGYEFKGWYTDKNCTTGNEWKSDSKITEATTVYAKWVKKEYVVGIYNGETLVRELSSKGTELYADNVTLKAGDIIRFSLGGGKWSRISLKTSGDGCAAARFEPTTVDGVDAIKLKNVTGGDTFNFYLDTGVSSTAQNLWTACTGTRKTSPLTDGDGVIAGTTLWAFKENVGGLNEVMVKDVTLSAWTLVSIKLGGKTANISLKTGSNGTLSGTTQIALRAGKYDFYIDYTNNTYAVYVAGSPFEVTLSANSAAFEFNDGFLVIQLGYIPSWGTQGTAFAYDPTTAWGSKYMLDGKSTYKINKNKSAVKFMVGFLQGDAGKNTKEIVCTTFDNEKVNTVTSKNSSGNDVVWTSDWYLDYTISKSNITYKK